MLAAIILGAALAYLGRNVAFLSWLAWGKSMGIDNVAIILIFAERYVHDLSAYNDTCGSYRICQDL